MTVWAGSLPSRGETKRFSRRTLQSSFAEAHDDSSPQGEPTLARRITSPALPDQKPSPLRWRRWLFDRREKRRMRGRSSPSTTSSGAPRHLPLSRGRNACAAHCSGAHCQKPSPAAKPQCGARGARKSQTAWLFQPCADAAVPQRVAFRPTGELTDEGKEGDLTKQVSITAPLISHLRPAGLLTASPPKGEANAPRSITRERTTKSLLPSGGARGVRKSQTAWLFQPSADAAVPQRMDFRPKGEKTDEGGDRHHPPPHPALRATFPSVGEGGKQARRITSTALPDRKPYFKPNKNN